MSHRLRIVVRLLSAVIVLGQLPSVAAAQAPTFEAFYAFGDSLADDGNVFITTKLLGVSPALPPSEHPHKTYFKGRFSNGYVGFEFLWQRLSGHAPGSQKGLRPSMLGSSSHPALDFAFGGTGTPYLDQTPGGLWAPGLLGQVDAYRVLMRGKKPHKRALYAIVTGANDYRDDPFNVPMDPQEVVNNIVTSIVNLYTLGARDIMVLELPDLGLVPANAGNPNATLISQLHNMILRAAIDQLRANLPALHLTLVDLGPLFDTLRIELESQVPALALVSPTAVACLFSDPTTCTDAPDTWFNNQHLGFLFWDVVHPTAQAHKRLGDYLYQQLQSSY